MISIFVVSSTGKLTPVGMWRYLASEESNLVDMTQLDLVMDMSQPLSHYYINSSHNTYCSGKDSRSYTVCDRLNEKPFVLLQCKFILS